MTMQYYILRPVYKLAPPRHGNKTSDEWDLSWSIEGTCTGIEDAKRQGFVAPVLKQMVFTPEAKQPQQLTFRNR